MRRRFLYDAPTGSNAQRRARLLVAAHLSGPFDDDRLISSCASCGVELDETHRGPYCGMTCEYGSKLIIPDAPLYAATDGSQTAPLTPDQLTPEDQRIFLIENDAAFSMTDAARDALNEEYEGTLQPANRGPAYCRSCLVRLDPVRKDPHYCSTECALKDDMPF